MDRKLLVIGLDGATFDLIHPWVEEGRLPGFATLLRGGVQARMRSTFPPITPPGWGSMITGVDLARRGLVGFRQRPQGGGQWRHLDSRSVREWFVFEHLARHGLKVACLNVPMTFPARRLAGGYTVSSTLGLAGLEIPGAFDPPELRPLLERAGLLGGGGGGADPAGGLAPPPRFDAETPRALYYDRMVLQQVAPFYRWRALLLDLLAEREHELDMVMFEVQETDGLLHYATRLPRDIGDRADHARQIKRVVFAIYRAVDELLCELQARYGRRWTIALVSDHGAGAIDMDWETYQRLHVRNGDGALGPIKTPVLREVSLDDTVAYLARSARVRDAKQGSAPGRGVTLAFHWQGDRRGLVAGVPGWIEFALEDLPAERLELSLGLGYQVHRGVEDLEEGVPLRLRVTLDGDLLGELSLDLRGDYDGPTVHPLAFQLPEGCSGGALRLELSGPPEAVAGRVQVFLEAPRVRLSGPPPAEARHVYRYTDSDGAELTNFNEVGLIGLSIRGRDRGGAIGPEELAARVEQVKEQLLALRHPRTGTALIDRVLTRDEVVEAADPDETHVDLMFTFAPEHHLPIREALEDDAYHVFVHHPQGVFALSGPGIREGVTLEELSITDFAPTVMHFFGLPVPDTMEGEVVAEALAEPGEVRRESAPPWTPSEGLHELSLEEQQVVEARLADLGYL